MKKKRSVMSRIRSAGIKSLKGDQFSKPVFPESRKLPSI